MTLKIFTDGGSRGNPGPSAIGIVCYKNGEELFRHREDIGIATNNVAEYRAVLKALELLEQKVTRYALHVTRIDFYSDSRLLVNQVNGLFKVKNARIRESIMKIRTLEADLARRLGGGGISVNYHLVPREKNRVADALVNEVE